MTATKVSLNNPLSRIIFLFFILITHELSAQIISGCTYSAACNYNVLANDDDGSCVYPDFGYDCFGNCLFDLNNNGFCDMEEVTGCIFPDAINYNPMATLDDGSCVITCRADFNNDGIVAVNDLLLFLPLVGSYCVGGGCMDPDGCNYDPEATFDLGYCEYPPEYYTCDGLPIDTDGDGIPDEWEVAGCTDPEAENYNPEATDDDGSCQYVFQNNEHSCGASDVHNVELVYGSISDIEGNTYRTIIIGNQEWMAENLNTSLYSNGDLIPNITDNLQWGVQTEGAWSYSDNDEVRQCPYGKLYNWYTTIDERNVCPTGWHVPSDEEWTELTDHLGGLALAGGKLKSSGTVYWASPNIAATNISGFSALPGGYRNYTGLFYWFLNNGYWWSSSENLQAFGGFYRWMGNGYESIYRGHAVKEDGFAIRCLKD